MWRFWITKGVSITGAMTAVAAGGSHTLAVAKDGGLWSWGSNLFGALEIGSTENQSQPVKIGTGYKRVAACGDRSVALKNDTSLWALGANNLQQLGDASFGARLAPAQVAAGIRGVSAGQNSPWPCHKTVPCALGD